MYILSTVYAKYVIYKFYKTLNFVNYLELTSRINNLLIN